MSYCCCSLAGTSACDHCTNRPSEWSKPVYVINPPFTVDSTNFPPQEFVPIVRCKDCKYFEEDLYKGLFEGDGVCFHEHWVLEDTGFEVKETDYCSYGERKEE